MHTDDYLREAKIFFATGQLEKSIEYFTLAYEQGGEPVAVCLSRGAAAMALGHYREAAEDFSRVLLEDADHERAHYYRGLAHAALGEYRQAIDDLTFSLTRNHDRGIAHLVRGVAYAELGEDTFAALDFNTASAFSEAEIKSFQKLFGNNKTIFQNTTGLLAKENAPWNNLLNSGDAEKLRNLLR
jgi:tetratricopeptide (TPR) repeat protein